jgi:hyaluronate lyase
LAKIAPQPYKSDFESLLLSWNEGSITTDKSDDSIQHATSLQKLRHKQALHPAKHNTGFQILPMSDRVVYHHQNWSATIAMSSNRTGRYESINSENLYPHYQGAGLFQLYLDNDRDHYLNDYYPTRRTHHLPGVTAGKNVQKIAEYGTRGTNAWAGGVKWNESGAASFDYISHDQVVNVKKSWFFVGDMILAMGTGCNGFNKTAVHTTIEARKMPNASRRLVVDGETLLKEPQSMESTHASWAHIDGVGGYHFLDFGKVNFERRNHTGRWTDINRYPNYIQYNETLSREYITVYRDHGVEPVNDRYVYAVLPNATIAETKAKLENLTYHILSNTPWVQAVALADQKVVMATFWQPGKVQDVEALNPCQIVWGSVGKHDKELLLTVADPSQQQEEIKFWLERPHIGKMISSSPEMQVVQDRGARKLIHVNVRNSSGQTFAITFGRYEETSVTELRTSWILLLMLCTVAVVLFVSPGARQSKEQSSNRLWRLYRNMRSR